MRLFISLILFLCAVAPAKASELKTDSTGASYAEAFKLANSFQMALKANDRKAIAQMLEYPIGVEYPLPSIKTPDEFIANWDDFFDKKSVELLINEQPETIGDKGIFFAGGSVWVRGGKIILGSSSESFSKKLAEAKAKEEQSLHPTLRGYRSFIIACSTPSKSIRLQEHEDGVHYFVWKKGQAHSEEPELELKGQYEYQGTMGGITYTFKNDNYSYVYDINNICEDPVCHNTLAVYKDGLELSRHICK